MSERDHVDDHAGVSPLTSAPQPDLVDGELELFEIPTKASLAVLVRSPVGSHIDDTWVLL
jgi:hypothetical protein